MGFGMTPLISRRGGTAYLLMFHLHTATALPLLGSSTSEGAFDASGGLAGGHTQLNADVELRDLERVYYCDATTEGSDMERVCFNSCNNINAKIAPQWYPRSFPVVYPPRHLHLFHRDKVLKTCTISVDDVVDERHQVPVRRVLPAAGGEQLPVAAPAERGLPNLLRVLRLDERDTSNLSGTRCV